MVKEMINKDNDERIQNYTYSHYVSFDNNNRCEILHGNIYNMVALSTTHQRLCGNLYTTIWNYPRSKDCEVFFEPFDVFLIDKDLYSCNKIVQPNISIICDKN